jgi:hypothetical protein
VERDILHEAPSLTLELENLAERNYFAARVLPLYEQALQVHDAGDDLKEYLQRLIKNEEYLEFILAGGHGGKGGGRDYDQRLGFAYAEPIRLSNFLLAGDKKPPTIAEKYKERDHDFRDGFIRLDSIYERQRKMAAQESAGLSLDENFDAESRRHGQLDRIYEQMARYGMALGNSEVTLHFLDKIHSHKALIDLYFDSLAEAGPVQTIVQERLSDLRFKLNDDPIALCYFLVRDVESGSNAYQNTRDFMDIMADKELIEHSSTDINLAEFKKSPSDLRMRMLRVLWGKGETEQADKVASTIDDVWLLSDPVKSYAEAYKDYRNYQLQQQAATTWRAKRQLRHLPVPPKPFAGATPKKVLSPKTLAENIASSIKTKITSGSIEKGVGEYENVLAKENVTTLDKLTATVILAGWPEAGAINPAEVSSRLEQPAVLIETQLEQLGRDVEAGHFYEGDDLAEKARARERIRAALGEIAAGLNNVNNQERRKQLSANIANLSRKLLS